MVLGAFVMSQILRAVELFCAALSEEGRWLLAWKVNLVLLPILCLYSFHTFGLKIGFDLIIMNVSVNYCWGGWGLFWSELWCVLEWSCQLSIQGWCWTKKWYLLCPASIHDNRFNCVFFCVSLAPAGLCFRRYELASLIAKGVWLVSIQYTTLLLMLTLILVMVLLMLLRNVCIAHWYCPPRTPPCFSR